MTASAASSSLAVIEHAWCVAKTGQVEVALGSTNLLFRVPQIHEEFRCCGTVPGIMIVAERETFQDFGYLVAAKNFPIVSFKNFASSGLLPRPALCPHNDGMGTSNTPGINAAS
jgi:hypothetical protein